MKIWLMMVVVQFLTLAVFAWFNRAAWIRILVLRQQLAVYKRKSKRPMLRNGDRLFWPLLSMVWRNWARSVRTHRIPRLLWVFAEHGLFLPPLLQQPVTL
jgi:hypothetical protein